MYAFRPVGRGLKIVILSPLAGFVLPVLIDYDSLLFLTSTYKMLKLVASCYPMFNQSHGAGLPPARSVVYLRWLSWGCACVLIADRFGGMTRSHNSGGGALSVVCEKKNSSYYV